MTTTVSMFSTSTITTTRTLTRTIITPTDSRAQPTGLDKPPNHNLEHDLASLYTYSPSLPLAAIFTILFLTTTLYHGYLSLYIPIRPSTADKHRYTIPFFIAALLSTLGYLLRCVSIQKSHVSDLNIYAASMALILISPIFICAALYLLLTRLIARCLPSTTTSTTPTVSYFTDPGESTVTAKLTNQTIQPNSPLFLRPKLLGAIFITSDLLSLLFQLFGAALAASSYSHRYPAHTHATPVILIGLSLQLLTFLFYLTTFHLFCRRVQSSPTTGFNPLIWKVVVATWIASGFVLVRSIFRIVEFAAEPTGYVARHEWCLYVFEGWPVWVGLVVAAWWHPVKWMQERSAATVVMATGRHREGGAEAVTKMPEVRQGQGHVGRRSRMGVGL